jgi:hypothetical protein
MPQTPGEVNEIRGRAGRVFRKTLQGGGKNLPEDFFPVGGAGKILLEEFSAAQRAAMMMQVVEPVA